MSAPLFDFKINDGDRPSRLTLGRQLTGELPTTFSGGDAPELAAFTRAIEDSRAKLPAFDLEVLRAAAERLDDAPPAAPTPGKPWWRAWTLALIPLAVAALALFAIQTPDPSGYTGIKGEADLGFFVLQDDEARPGVDGERLRPGDRVQFSYEARGPDTLVIVGVDGTGAATVYYPERGNQPEPIEPFDRRILEGSIELDDAPGPEVFVAVFDVDDVEEARELVEDVFAEAGWDGLEALGREDAYVDTVRVEKALE